MPPGSGPKRGLLLVGLVLALVGCRLDVAVELVIGADGTGSLTVTAVADAGLVRQAPGLAEDLRFEDAVAAGWTVDGPTATDDGGLRIALAHPVASAAEATNLLASLGPPLRGVAVAREVSEDGDTTTLTMTGELVLEGGFDAFADADLVAAIGGAPFADDLAAAGATPSGSMSLVLRADVPGDVDAQSTGVAVGAVREWEAPLDGSVVPVQLRSVQEQGGGGWWSVLATALVVLLVLWVAAAAAFIVSVVRARARKAQRRRRALARLR